MKCGDINAITLLQYIHNSNSGERPVGFSGGSKFQEVCFFNNEERDGYEDPGSQNIEKLKNISK